MGRIEDEFSDRGIVRGRTLMVPAEIALEMVRRSRDLQVKVLGIDGFMLTPTTTQAVWEHSLDLTRLGDLSREAECWDRAEQFLLERKQMDLYFWVDLNELNDGRSHEARSLT